MTVLTGSMQPTLNPGDVIAVRSPDTGTFGVGDIVTYRPKSGDNTVITHRIVEKTVALDGTVKYITRGDDNNATDAPILPEQIVGVYMYDVPYVGYVFSLAGSNGPAIAIGLAAALLGYAVWTFRPRRPRRPDDSSKAPPLPGTRRAARMSAAALMTATIVLSPVAAHAADDLTVTYDGDTTHLSWDGTTYSTQETGFFGDLSAVPGDRVSRSAIVTNNGPGPGLLSVSIANMRVDVALGDYLTITLTSEGETASSTFTQLQASGGKLLIDKPLAQGASRRITLAFEYAADATEANRADVGAQGVSFDVRYDIRSPDEQTDGSGAAATPQRPVVPSPVDMSALARTGGVLAAALIGGGIICFAGGLTAIILGRRRRKEDA